ncbi:relaxase/mobilization nuclease domain-containing protein [Streptobacillus moniliformis]|uniref:relaxase/mobilization nuclease domain-containing protein n=1 Tax=Streptobacillus moniliformis TaxID=34105 RepID=UPI0009BD9785|nr:relaxase/mobilization nuclease domain-containing protein [Streptobacillus moniliformis]
MESRIHREVYVRFGGEYLKTYIRNNARRWILSLLNSIDVDEGKVYHSYYGSYMNIRNQSDKLCKEHNLSVIDQGTQTEINEIKRRKFVNWYDWNEDKKGNSYKSRLQFDMDRVIQKAINWEHFLKIMEQYGYEIKFGKHIAFKQKNQQRFTRAKTIGTNYTEEKIKERIRNKDKEIGEFVDKTKYENQDWVVHTNMQVASKILLKIRDKGFNSMEALEKGIQKISFQKNKLKQEFDKLSWEQKRIKEVVKHIQICIIKREHYEGHRKNPNDKIYMMINRKDIEAYQKSYEEIDIFLKQFPHIKDTVLEGLKNKSGKNLFRKLNEHSKNLGLKQEGIAKQHDSLMEEFTELKHLKNNMDDYLGREQKTEKKMRESILKQIKEIGGEDRERKLPKNRGIER